MPSSTVALGQSCPSSNAAKGAGHGSFRATSSPSRSSVPELGSIYSAIALALAILTATANAAEASEGDAQSQRDSPGSTSDTTDAGAQVELGPKKGFVVSLPKTGSRLELHYATWFRFDTNVVTGVETRPAFTVPLVRPLMQGSFLSDRIRFLVQPELAGTSVRLLDAQLEAVLHPDVIVRLGQFRTPYSRAYITPIVQLQLPTRGIVDEEFRLGRDTGMMLYGQPLDDQLEYYLGAFSGARINDLFGNEPEPMIVARLAYNMGAPVPYDQAPAAERPADTGVAVGINGGYRRRRVSGDGDALAIESLNGGMDVAFMSGRVAASAQGFIRSMRPEGGSWQLGWGSFVQGGVFLWPRVFEVAARLGWMDRNLEADNQFLQTYELSLNGYLAVGDRALGHHLKAQLLYAFDEADQPFDAGSESGERHRVMMQVQAWM